MMRTVQGFTLILGASGAGLAGNHLLLMFVVSALTTLAMIGLSEVAHYMKGMK